MDFIVDDFPREFCVHKRDAQSRNKSADVHYTYTLCFIIFLLFLVTSRRFDLLLFFVYKAVFTPNSGYCEYSSITKEIFVILLFA